MCADVVLTRRFISALPPLVGGSVPQSIFPLVHFGGSSMKRDYIEQVKTDVAKRAGISLKQHKNIEILADQASSKLGLPKIVRGEAESMVSFAGRMVKHFGLGREYDVKVPDKQAKIQRRMAWQNYQDRRMGLK
jgi:hypothetical protein